MSVPAFRFSSAELPAEEAFEAWRLIMARMFDIDRKGDVNGLPRGGVSAFLLGDMMANRSVFNAQSLTRDRHRIAATPDHLVFQLYLWGGFTGEIGGRSVEITRGQVAVCDLRRPLAVDAVKSSTLGLSIPRNLVDGVDLERLMPRLDPARERLLAARMTTLHRRLPMLQQADLSCVSADLVGFLQRLLAPSVSEDVMNSSAFDTDLLALVEQVITSRMASLDPTPSLIADGLRVSRSTLYRVFKPFGGLMQHVWTIRLQAVRAALDQPSESRTLSRLATDHGFKSGAHLSRTFRQLYGVAPREWRARVMAQSSDDWQIGSARLNTWWHALGR